MIKLKKKIALFISLVLIFQLFVTIPASAANSDAFDYTELCSSIKSNPNIKEDAKDYINSSIKTYINNNTDLQNCLKDTSNTLLFFYEGASRLVRTTYNDTRNNAALLMVANQNGKPVLLSCSPYFSTMPDDPVAVGCYTNQLDGDKSSYGPGTLKDGIYKFEFKTKSYRTTGCKAYVLSGTKSVYLTSSSYETLTSTDILIYGRKI